jgi:alkylation response protein AidB-like acyl-CoA dehydrogenase
MDLALTAEQESFRAEARAWLDANIPAEPLASMDTADGFEQHREWERTLHHGGWGTVAWPVEYGGRGADLVQWLIFDEEYYASGAPGRVNQNGLFLLAPTMMEYGSEELKARFLPSMAAGDEIWAQGWSEPNAGSDLAALRSRADRDGDDWVLNGQKTWCSRGAYADWMFGLFRSDPASQRHHGLTFILVPLDAEGVTIRPIRQLDGEAGFAEVFLDDVRVPVANTLGDEGAGWKVTMSTAGFERGLLLRPPGRFLAAADRLEQLCEELGDDAEPALRERVRQCRVDAEAYRLNTWWTVSRLLDGATIGAEASMNKIFWSQMDIRIHETAIALLGARGLFTGAAPDAADDGRWLDGYLFSLAGPIYAGTNEVQRNIVAERVLGLPRTPR